MLSVIIPVYNVEKYLKKCISSVQNQTYKNLEIILVDDGSKDNSATICDDFAKRDNRVKVIHKANGGVSSARNAGLDVACGEYVMFVDADDWIPYNSVELLIKGQSEKKSDFVMGAAEAVGVFKKEYYGKNGTTYIDFNNEKELLNFTEVIKTQLGPWAKLFKKSIIDKYNLRFLIGVAYGEDRIFNWEYLLHCNNALIINNIVYYYSQLNIYRACGRYYPDINIWLSTAVEKYSKLLKGKTNHIIDNICKTACFQFEVCCKHYLLHIKNDKNACINQIEKSKKLFIQIIEKCFEDEEDLNRYIKNSDVPIMQIMTQDAEKIYNYYKENFNQKTDSFFKRKIRNMMVKIKRIIVYKKY